jgi:hypothetical protein
MCRAEGSRKLRSDRPALLQAAGKPQPGGHALCPHSPSTANQNQNGHPSAQTQRSQTWCTHMVRPLRCSTGHVTAMWNHAELWRPGWSSVSGPLPPNPFCEREATSHPKPCWLYPRRMQIQCHVFLRDRVRNRNYFSWIILVRGKNSPYFPFRKCY